MHEGLIGEWKGPLVWWQPVSGERHALSPELRPAPGQERDTVCGVSVTLGEPSAADWLAPTCDDCWAAALQRRDEQDGRGKGRRAR